jgi:hypothetical protein
VAVLWIAEIPDWTPSGQDGDLRISERAFRGRVRHLATLSDPR